MKIDIVFTCHNRIEKTKKCVEQLIQEIRNDTSGNRYSIIACDDGSLDGTGDMLRYNHVDVVCGDGTLYWTRGMFNAMERAKNNNPDIYIIINDDVSFHKGALKILLDEYLSHDERKIAIVGDTTDTNGEKFSYGGYTWKGRIFRKNYRKVFPSDQNRRCKEANWNCFLISRELFDEVGEIDTYYEHGFADYDYTNRITNTGYPIFVAPRYVGTCDRNSVEGTYMDHSLPMIKRFSLINQKKAQPIKSCIHYGIKFYGFLSIFYILEPYVYVIATSIHDWITHRYKHNLLS